MYHRPESMVDQVIDGHRIDSVLGRGGMGIVYKAENLALGRTVALKVINPAMAQDDSFLRRFHLEARALAQIQHPNIVILYSFNKVDENLCYLSMEYVDGPTLSEYLTKCGPIAWQQALPLIKQLLSAFDYAHQTGVIHRDIKPGNIMISKRGQVKITDFGLAKVLQGGSSDLTVTQATAGTVHYMSPEQIKGLGKVDHRGDLFSLGLTLYETLTGKLPFDKNSSVYTIQKAIVEEDFLSLDKLNPALPRQLGRIIMKSLEKDPARRYQRAGEMLRAIEEFEAERLTPTLRAAVTPPPPKQPLPPIRSQVRPSLTAAIVVVFIVIAALAAIWYPVRQTTPPESRADTPPNLAAETDRSAVPTSTDTPSQPRTTPSQNSTPETTPPPPEEDDPVATGDPVATTAPPETPVEDVADSSSTEVDPLDDPEDTLIASNNDPATDPSSDDPGTESYTTDFLNDPAADSAVAGAPTGTLWIRSSPPDAEIFLNDSLVGRTPQLVGSLTEGPFNIELRKEGFEPFRTAASVVADEQQTIDGELAALMGTLQIRAQPWGTIYIDGEERAREADYTWSDRLPVAKTYTVRVENDRYGRWEQEVSLSAETLRDIQVDFTQRIPVTVIARGPGNIGLTGEIFIDGKGTGYYTPSPVFIPLGIREVEVKASGYEQIDGARVYNFDGLLEEPFVVRLERSSN